MNFDSESTRNIPSSGITYTCCSIYFIHIRHCLQKQTMWKTQLSAFENVCSLYGLHIMSFCVLLHHCLQTFINPQTSAQSVSTNTMTPSPSTQSVTGNVQQFPNAIRPEYAPPPPRQSPAISHGQKQSIETQGNAAFSSKQPVSEYQLGVTMPQSFVLSAMKNRDGQDYFVISRCHVTDTDGGPHNVISEKPTESLLSFGTNAGNTEG